jgi:hypothetical protein
VPGFRSRTERRRLCQLWLRRPWSSPLAPAPVAAPPDVEPRLRPFTISPIFLPASSRTVTTAPAGSGRGHAGFVDIAYL